MDLSKLKAALAGVQAEIEALEGPADEEVLDEPIVEDEVAVGVPEESDEEVPAESESPDRKKGMAIAMLRKHLQ